MEGRRLIEAILNDDDFDRFGLYEYFWPETTERWVAQGYPVDDAGKPVDPEVHFGFDLRACGGWFDHFPIRGYREVVSETDEWEAVRNGAGAVLKYWKHRSGTPEHVEFRMTSREVWEADYRPHLLSTDPLRLKLPEDREALARGRRDGRWTFFGHVFLWETMRPSLGDVCMYESYALDPGWVRDYHEVHLEFFRSHFGLLFEKAGMPDAVTIYEDLAYRNGLFVSPRMLRDSLLPYYVELVAWFHSLGLRVHFHSCGNVTEALPLIVEAGFDSLNPMEVKAGCDLGSFVRDYGDRLAFVGGFDVRVLETNDGATIQSSVGAHLEAMKRIGARYVFASDHSIPPSVSYDAYRWALEAFWRTAGR
ncbi:MAG: hypothetical protein KIS66_06385 [Fimbriimonadaceae bacterium]|nr:hypothetical protein [Fimbriimonadaceae bacterium]